MNEDYIGFVRMFAGNFVPFIGYYASCSGQKLLTGQYQAVFSILGHQFGGNSFNDFNLPDFRSRMPVGPNYYYPQGSTGGVENVTLTEMEMPAHSHTCNGLTGGLEVPSPKGAFLPQYGKTGAQFYAELPSDAYTIMMNTFTMTPVGGNQAHTNMSPFLAFNFIICLQGQYPPRPNDAEEPSVQTPEAE